jgi:peptide/nickel transport system ATP-binding protein
MPDSLLRVDGVSIAFASPAGETFAARDVTFDVGTGEIVGLVGESGSGKTSLALAILNYLPRGGRVTGGDIAFRGKSLLAMSAREKRRIYGRHIAHVAQDPAAALNPALKISTQLEEGMRAQLGSTAADARRRALALLDEVRLPGGERTLDSYPHQLSGGMQQRVCIGMALACDPALIVMDEPTTGLDASTETAIFDLLRELKSRRGLSVLFISHNLAAVRGMADRVVILYGGRRMEVGATAAVFNAPRHRYTQLMLHAVPTMRGPVQRAEMPWQGARPPEQGCPFRDRCDIAEDACMDPPTFDAGAGHLATCVRADSLPPVVAPPVTADRVARDSQGTLLELRNVSHRYAGRRGGVDRLSLHDVSFDLRAGEVLAIIGESGSGKTTVARCIIGLARPFAGSIRFADRDLASLRRYPLDVARALQIVFQNIGGSLHPRKRIMDILARPFVLYEQRKPSIGELERLANGFGLRSELLPKRSPRLSGGERQRAALARALAPRPSAIVLDEAFSALDVSMKNKAINLLLGKRAENDSSYLLISHDLPLVRAMADRVLILYRGHVCEVGPRALLETAPCHPYTETLVWSALELEGEKPASLDLRQPARPDDARTPTGCPFHLRCPRKLGAICEEEAPPLRTVEGAHTIACHMLIDELSRLQRAEHARDVLTPEAA